MSAANMNKSSAQNHETMMTLCRRRRSRRATALDNAGQLIGLAAECAVKYAVRHVAPNPPRIHFPELTAQIRKIGGRHPVVSQIRRALSPPALGSIFDDWSIAIRYCADGHVGDAQYRRWKVATGQIMSAARITRQ